MASPKLQLRKGKIMTATRKLAIVGGLALLFGIALMTVLHQFGLGHFATVSASTPWTYPMMPNWAMALGPVAMALWFGGILSLVVALVRSVAKAS
jgi:hypothetical protein